MASVSCGSGSHTDVRPMGGVSLGLRQGKSSGLGWEDVMLEAVNLQRMVGGQIVLLLIPELRRKSWDLVVRATRHRPEVGCMDQPPSVSVSVSCRAANYLQVESVCMSALHQLDVMCYATGAYTEAENKA